MVEKINSVSIGAQEGPVTAYSVSFIAVVSSIDGLASQSLKSLLGSRSKTEEPSETRWEQRVSPKEAHMEGRIWGDSQPCAWHFGH